jgi:hypothetical protein
VCSGVGPVIGVRYDTDTWWHWITINFLNYYRYWCVSCIRCSYMYLCFIAHCRSLQIAYCGKHVLECEKISFPVFQTSREHARGACLRVRWCVRKQHRTPCVVLVGWRELYILLVIHPDFSAYQNYPKTWTKSTYLDFKWCVTE